MINNALVVYERLVNLDIGPMDSTLKHAWYLFYVGQLLSYLDCYIYVAKKKYISASRATLAGNALVWSSIPLYMWLQLRFCFDGYSGFELMTFGYLQAAKYVYYIISSLGQGIEQIMS